MQIYFRGYTKKVILEVTVFSWRFLCFDQSDSFSKFLATILYHRKKTRCKIKYRPTLTTPIVL